MDNKKYMLKGSGSNEVTQRVKPILPGLSTTSTKSLELSSIPEFEEETLTEEKDENTFWNFLSTMGIVGSTDTTDTTKISGPEPREKDILEIVEIPTLPEVTLPEVTTKELNILERPINTGTRDLMSSVYIDKYQNKIVSNNPEMQSLIDVITNLDKEPISKRFIINTMTTEDYFTQKINNYTFAYDSYNNEMDTVYDPKNLDMALLEKYVNLLNKINDYANITYIF
jgi:hypothetical protein